MSAPSEYTSYTNEPEIETCRERAERQQRIDPLGYTSYTNEPEIEPCCQRAERQQIPRITIEDYRAKLAKWAQLPLVDDRPHLPTGRELEKALQVRTFRIVECMRGKKKVSRAKAVAIIDERIRKEEHRRIFDAQFKEHYDDKSAAIGLMRIVVWEAGGSPCAQNEAEKEINRIALGGLVQRTLNGIQPDQVEGQRLSYVNTYISDIIARYVEDMDIIITYWQTF